LIPPGYGSGSPNKSTGEEECLHTPGDWDKLMKLWGTLCQWTHTKPSPTNKQTNKQTNKITLNNSYFRIRSTFNIYVLNALWAIVSGQKVEQDDPKMNNVVKMLYNFIIDTGKPVTNFGTQFKWLNGILEGLGFYNVTGAVKALVEFADETIHLREHNINLEDEYDDFIGKFIKTALQEK
jgi:hypothetical protein